MECYISKVTQRELSQHIERTGVDALELLAGRKDIPRGLEVEHINGWVDGSLSRGEREHIDYVSKVWSEVDEFIELTKLMVMALKEQQKRTGIDPVKLFETIEDIPAQLTSRNVEIWMIGATRNVRRAQYKFVLMKWQEVANKDGSFSDYQ